MKTQTSPYHYFLHILMPVILCISILLIVSGCYLFKSNEDPLTSSILSTTNTLASSDTVTDTTVTTAPETTAVTETVVAESETTPESTLLTDMNSIEIYWSHAYMVSFDTSTGLAQFDYFDILTGQDAIDWLVEHEGYTQEDAQAKVNNFADTEYVEKNINPQLRTIDMTTVSITTNRDENGFLALPAITLTYNEFIDRIDEFLYTASYQNVSEIIVKDEKIVEVNVCVFMG